MLTGRITRLLIMAGFGPLASGKTDGNRWRSLDFGVGATVCPWVAARGKEMLSEPLPG
jgi:hypothetical protein